MSNRLTPNLDGKKRISMDILVKNIGRNGKFIEQLFDIFFP